MYENKPIEYTRFRKVSMDSITDERGKIEIKRKTIVRGFDPILHKFVEVDKIFSFHTMESVGCFKELTQSIYVKRVAVGSDMKEMSKWFKVRRKVSVINKDNNIFLTQADGRIFQSDCNITAPMNLNYIPEGIKISKIDESPLTATELRWLERQLNDEKVYIKPLCVDELQNGELRIAV